MFLLNLEPTKFADFLVSPFLMGSKPVFFVENVHWRFIGVFVEFGESGKKKICIVLGSNNTIYH